MTDNNNDDIFPQKQNMEKYFPEINKTIAVSKAISYSLLFSLQRQHLITQSQNERYIQAVPPIRMSPGEPYFLRLEKVSGSIDTSLQQQLVIPQTIPQTTLSACHNPGDDKLIFIISRNATNNHIYLGSISRDTSFVNDLKSFLEGDLPDTQLKLCFPTDEDFTKQIKTPMNNFKCATALTGIPSLNPAINSNNYQIDRLLGSMGSDSQFIYMVIAEPMAETEVNEIIYNLSELKALVSFLKQEVIFNNTLSEKISEQLEQVNSRTEASENTDTKSNSSQFNADPMEIVIKVLGTYFPKLKFVADLLPFLKINLESKEQRTQQEKETKTDEEKISKSDESTQSREQISQQKYINTQAQVLEKLIERYIERFETARALGCWNVGVYFLAQRPDIVQRGVKFLKGLVSGEKSVLEPIRIHDLESVLRASSSVYGDGSQQKFGALDMLKQFEQPSLALVNPQNPQQLLNHPLGSAFNGLTTPLNTQELSFFINLPSNNYLR
jgi:hypothetical protein